MAEGSECSTSEICDKVSNSNINMTNHKRTEVFIIKVRVNLKKLNKDYLEQLVNIDEGCTDIIINSDTAEDVHVHNTDSEYVENVGTVDQPAEETELYSAEERKGVSADETEDNSSEETGKEVEESEEGCEDEETSEYYTMQDCKEDTPLEMKEEPLEDSVDETGKDAADKTPEYSVEESEDDLGEEREASDYSAIEDVKDEITIAVVIKEELFEAVSVYESPEHMGISGTS